MRPKKGPEAVSRQSWEIRDRELIRSLAGAPGLTTRFGRSTLPGDEEGNPLVLTTSEGSIHAQLRSVFGDAVRTVRREPLQAVVDEAFRALVRGSAGMPLDLVASGLGSIAAFVVGDILGVPERDRSELASLHRKQARAAERGLLDPAGNELAMYLAELRRLAIARPEGRGTWNALAAAPALAGRARDQLHNASLLYEAGIDALDTMVYSAVIESGRIGSLAGSLSQADVAEWLVARSSPVERLSKVAVDRILAGDCHIEPGDAVVFCYRDANSGWQPACGRHVAFGCGAHMCIAAGLATSLARMLVSNVVRADMQFQALEPPRCAANASLRVFESIVGVVRAGCGAGP